MPFANLVKQWEGIEDDVNDRFKKENPHYWRQAAVVGKQFGETEAEVDHAAKSVVLLIKMLFGITNDLERIEKELDSLWREIKGNDNIAADVVNRIAGYLMGVDIRPKVVSFKKSLEKGKRQF